MTPEHPDPIVRQWIARFASYGEPPHWMSSLIDTNAPKTLRRVTEWSARTMLTMEQRQQYDLAIEVLETLIMDAMDLEMVARLDKSEKRAMELHSRLSSFLHFARGFTQTFGGFIAGNVSKAEAERENKEMWDRIAADKKALDGKQ